MENIHENEVPTPEEGYVPRPKWQIWGARLGLVIFILFVIFQLYSIANGGL